MKPEIHYIYVLQSETMKNEVSSHMNQVKDTDFNYVGIIKNSVACFPRGQQRKFESNVVLFCC